MKITEITTVKQQITTKIRLAAYCRVSSDSADQLHSFAAQIRYYSEYTAKHPEYELVDIYADEGLTGTEMKKRDELNRLIRDCKKGLIDRIIVKSVSRFARNTEELLVTLRNLGVLQTLKVHIGMGLQSEQTEDNSMDLQIRIAEIDAEFKAMLAKISTDTVDAFDEEKAKRLMDEKARLQQQLGNIRDGQLKREQTQSRLDDIYTILDGLKNQPMEYDEQIVRQLLECITVDSKEQITVIFVGGLKVVQPLID